jgi:hypothetical protein
MTQVLEMPAPEAQQSGSREAEEQEIRSRKEEAQFHWKQISQAAVLQSRNSLRLGFHAYQMKKKGLWGMIGLRDESEAREKAGVSESGWYANIRLAETFDGLPEELFVQMKNANAKVLADLPDAKRLDRDWVGWATTESMKVFQERVDLEMNGKTKASEGREPIHSFKTTMPASQKKSVEAGIKQYAVSVGLDPANTGKVLETAMVELNQGAGLIGAITTAVQKVKSAKEVIHSGRSLEEVVEAVEKVLDEVVLDFAAALEQASQRGSEAA